MFVRILIGAVVCAIGFLLVRKTDWALDTVGSINFAEKMFSGGSRSFYKLFGVIVILIGFLVITNLHESFFGGLFHFFFG